MQEILTLLKLAAGVIFPARPSSLFITLQNIQKEYKLPLLEPAPYSLLGGPQPVFCHSLHMLCLPTILSEAGKLQTTEMIILLCLLTWREIVNTAHLSLLLIYKWQIYQPGLFPYRANKCLSHSCDDISILSKNAIENAFVNCLQHFWRGGANNNSPIQSWCDSFVIWGF